MTKKILSLSIALGLFFMQQVFSQAFTKDQWTVLSENGTNKELSDTSFLGVNCLKLDGKNIAAIWNKTANQRNFRMELDVAGEVMSGIGFHVADEQNYQFIYFRPGYGNTKEAIQYIPIYNGALSWVFYGDYQNTADIKKLQWFHAAIEVMDDNLKVFVNYNKAPDMQVKLLKTKSNEGSILLRSMFGTSYFANIKIMEAPSQLVNWEISEQFPKDKPIEYGDIKKVKKWTNIAESDDNYVNFCRYFENPNGIIFAKRTITVDAEQKRKLDFDFAGKLSIYLNGKVIYKYEKGYLDRLVPEGNHIFLDLLKGNNELCLVSEGDADIFGKGYNSLGRLQHQNWGFIGRMR